MGITKLACKMSFFCRSRTSNFVSLGLRSQATEMRSASWAFRESLEKRLPELKEYDHVLLEFGGNDCDYAWPKIAEKPDDNYFPNTSPEVFSREYARMIREVRAAGSSPVILSLPPIDAKRYFNWFSRGIDGEKVLRWLGDVEHIYRWHEMYNMAAVRLANETGTPLVDITSAFLQSKDCDRLICDDGIHPNERGHELISEVLGEEIRNYRVSRAS